MVNTSSGSGSGASTKSEPWYEKLEDDVKALIKKIEASPVVKKAETNIEAIGGAGLDYIKENGGKAAYNLATALLMGAASGTSWLTLGAALVAQAKNAAITIGKGAESVILGQAQADLIATGKLAAPTTGAVVAAPVTAS